MDEKPVPGMEPALKLAHDQCPEGRILVLATPVSLASEKYRRLYENYGEHAVSLPCPGLMEFVERGDTDSEELKDYLRANGFHGVLYKCIPWMYHQMAAEEDLYAMARTCDARLQERDLGTVIIQRNAIRWERVRRRALKRALEAGITVERSTDFAGFWQVLNDNLRMKYNSKPVHTLDEISLLASRFPDNIVLYLAKLHGDILAGMVVYVSTQVARAQYSSATPLGKQLGAIDVLYDRIVCYDYHHLPYFEFGTSAMPDSNAINETLIFQKEGFGGRGICFDRYEWTL